MACCEVISFFIVLGYNEIKFKCAWLRLTTQNEIPTQHPDPNNLFECVMWVQGRGRGEEGLSSFI